MVTQSEVDAALAARERRDEIIAEFWRDDHIGVDKHKTMQYELYRVMGRSHAEALEIAGGGTVVACPDIRRACAELRETWGGNPGLALVLDYLGDPKFLKWREHSNATPKERFTAEGWDVAQKVRDDDVHAVCRYILDHVRFYADQLTRMGWGRIKPEDIYND